ncbi:DUF4431 domain-containing protein [Atlantibacter hermannii]|uniref:DUF4431 domain-containing protein n=1 Tax=Atlantibacter hermannii TaxID=565 RepID=UPI00254FA2B4|nr:DUF4431 domain-containing protein [Atlantibacter hermannii]
MRYFLLFLLMYLSNAFSAGMESLPVDDFYRKDIAQSIRQQENLQDKKFNIRRIEKENDVAYFCGLIKDKENNFQQTASGKYHIYDRIMLDAGREGWISAVQFDRDVPTLEEVHCHYGKETALASTELMKLIQAEGSKELCQDVNLKDPLRSEILDVLRTRYLGDSNTLTLNGTLPAVKFVVKQMCATEAHAWFCGKASGDTRSPYEHETGELEVFFKKGVEGRWQTVPENAFVSQQGAISWCQYRNEVKSAKALAEIIKQRQQKCLVEGDVLSIDGLLKEKGAGDNAYWVIQPDEPLSCVRDARMSNSDGNQEIQLVLTAEERQLLNNLVDKKVRVGGDILLALSSQHHTETLLENIFLLKEQN